MLIIKYRPTKEPTHYERIVKNLTETYPDYPCVNCKRRAKGKICKCAANDCNDWAAWFRKTWEGFKKGAIKNDSMGGQENGKD